MLKRFAAAAMTAIVAMAVASAIAQESYPGKPIKIVVPFTPGTGIDILARTLAQKIGDDWKIAATVVLVLGVAAAVVAALGTDARWLAPVCGGALVLAFVLTFVADNRR